MTGNYRGNWAADLQTEAALIQLLAELLDDLAEVSRVLLEDTSSLFQTRRLGVWTFLWHGLIHA